jgi:SAM-dependent methyltransferase
MDVIERFAAHGSVLDVGCVDARTQLEDSQTRIERKPNALFRRIVEINSDVTGLDIDAAGVEALNAMGYRVVCANAETADLGRTFETIVAGEIIEHLENPGQFVRNMHRHLTPGGKLLISTPNPFYHGQTWKIWRYGRPAVHEDHTLWQDPITLEQLLKRAGMRVAEGYWIQPRTRLLKSWKRAFRPYFAHSFLVVAESVTAEAEKAA